MKTYEIIYADPPWQYRDLCHAGERGVAYKYKVLSVEQLKAFEVPASKDALLFMWATWPTLPDALAVMAAWGFEYKTAAFVWIKMNKRWRSNQVADPFLGMGNYSRANSEIVLLGRRGKIKRVANDVEQVVLSVLRGHSQKPPEVRERIVELMGDRPRLEMFARSRTPGWDVFGDEVQGSIEIKNPLIK